MAVMDANIFHRRFEEAVMRLGPTTVISAFLFRTKGDDVRCDVCDGRVSEPGTGSVP